MYYVRNVWNWNIAYNLSSWSLSTYRLNLVCAMENGRGLDLILIHSISMHQFYFYLKAINIRYGWKIFHEILLGGMHSIVFLFRAK